MLFVVVNLCIVECRLNKKNVQLSLNLASDIFTFNECITHVIYSRDQQGLDTFFFFFKDKSKEIAGMGGNLFLIVIIYIVPQLK